MPAVRMVAALLAACCLGGAALACAPRDRAARYDLQGQVLAVRPARDEVVIKHQDIKGFMPGMTMPFKVRDRALLTAAAPGDLVTATLAVEASGAAWIEQLRKTGTAPVAQDDAGTAPPVVLEPGEAMPAAALVDQDGQPLSTDGLRGHASVVTFIYTRCPLPQFCPLMDRRFAELQERIQRTPGWPGRVRLLSVSFDPDHDSPAVLRAHANRLGAVPAIWTFATGPREEVDRLAAAFGVAVMREADRSITHNLRTAVFDPSGRAVAVYSGGDWTADAVAADLARALPSR